MCRSLIEFLVVVHSAALGDYKFHCLSDPSRFTYGSLSVTRVRHLLKTPMEPSIRCKLVLCMCANWGQNTICIPGGKQYTTDRENAKLPAKRPTRTLATTSRIQISRRCSTTTTSAIAVPTPTASSSGPATTRRKDQAVVNEGFPSVVATSPLYVNLHTAKPSVKESE
ncbi:MAG: hypothetical protein LQ341_000163 [Variospora aurantia]|nr:MAG: hypothetical protein LQ341_000163 [Variospora aurantia]